MSRDYVYRHWRALGGYKDTDSKVKFTVRALDRHLATRTPGPRSAPRAPTPVPLAPPSDGPTSEGLG